MLLVPGHVHFLRVEIPNCAWLIAQFCWLNHVKSLLPVKSPLLPGEKLEGVQDALKGFQATNGVLWFHQEAGPGASAELMVGDAFFRGNDW